MPKAVEEVVSTRRRPTAPTLSFPEASAAKGTAVKVEISIRVALTPILDGQACLNGLELATDIATPGGAVKLLRLSSKEDVEPKLPELVRQVQESNVFCTAAEVRTTDRMGALYAAMQVVQADFFRPNILWQLPNC